MNFFRTLAMVGLVGVGMVYGEDAPKKRYVVLVKPYAPFNAAIRSRLRFEYLFDDKGLFYSVIRELISPNKADTATPSEGSKPAGHERLPNAFHGNGVETEYAPVTEGDVMRKMLKSIDRPSPSPTPQ